MKGKKSKIKGQVHKVKSSWPMITVMGSGRCVKSGTFTLTNVIMWDHLRDEPLMILGRGQAKVGKRFEWLRSW